ncbi:hypothetical protein ACFX1W_036070 [Malus domestica]
MKNHQAQPTGSNAPPEAHTTNSSNYNRQKPHCGHGNGWKGPPRAQGPLNRSPSKGGNLTRSANPLPLRHQTSRTREKLLFDQIPLNWTCATVVDQRIMGHAYAELPPRLLPSIIPVVRLTLCM